MEGFGDFAHLPSDLGNRVVDLGFSAKTLVRSVNTQVPCLTFARTLQCNRSRIVQTRVLRIPLLPDLERLFWS